MTEGTAGHRHPWVQVYKDDAGEWRWRRYAANGKIIAESGEGYDNRSWAARMAEEQFPWDDLQLQADRR